MDPKDLEIVGIIAFDGTVQSGLQVHPDEKHILYPMGTKITVKNIDTGKQTFLTGHTNVISALSVSPCGKFIGSGQLTYLGFKATVIIWDYESKSIKGRHEIHKVSVENLCFTCESNYLVSLGGKDDGNVVIWDVFNNEAICGSVASNETAGNAFTIARMNIRDQCFITGGDTTLKVWRINPETRKVFGVNVKVGKLRRTVNCIVVDTRDEMAYCGTSSGDIIKARLNYYHNLDIMEPVQSPIMVGCYSKIPKEPKKLKDGEGQLYSGGVTSLLLLDDDKLVVGAGDGSVESVEIVEGSFNFSGKSVKLPSTPQIRVHATEYVKSAVTSMLLYDTNSVLVGTAACDIYLINLSDFDTRLIVTCHRNTIYDIAFPSGFSEIFATGCKNDIRLWHLESHRELLRITVPNFVCTNLCFTQNGKSLISAWNDGIVRAFKPTNGQLIFAINNAHIKAVSAICVTRDGTRLVTGGCDGQVRIWSLFPEVQRLESIMKEHRGPVTSLQMSSNDTEAISSSTDGICIIWDINRCLRKQVLMGNTMFMSARFSPNGVQVLTCGTDRKIAYWETLDGSLIRELEGSSAGGLNCLDTSPDGRYFVTGSNDCIVKIWEYNRGDTTHIGLGHAAIITACKFSPDSKHIVTVSADGAIMIWKCPFEAKFDDPPATPRSLSTCSLREEEWRKLHLREMDRDSVANLSGRSNLAESVRTVHENKSKVNLCTYDPAKPKRGACQCHYDEEKELASEKGTHRSDKSSGKAHGDSSRSKKSSSSTSSSKGSSKSRSSQSTGSRASDGSKKHDKASTKAPETPKLNFTGTGTPGPAKNPLENLE
ncbi:cilia- and flagella-associated protein 52 [Venturia canescens]|uniref:cilia- and flagella-associated protein 52 n=1 Tax=Venturia canescens TaxID=32260 RepID=UPI001C9CDEA6|nr:cilia- and flagella-associated protein 52 [Venturia canescens]